MEENRARRVADALRDRGINAHFAEVGTYQFGVRVILPDGDLVGYVPEIKGSETFTEEQVIDAIARTDYDQPIAEVRSSAPPPAPALPREGGLFRRFRDGLRYR
jgi:hypothetical protein